MGTRPSPGGEQFEGVFDPRNLQGQTEGDQPAPGTEGGVTESPGAEQYRGIFDPRNLESQTGTSTGEEGGTPVPQEEPESPGAEQYRGIFDPQNLKSQSGTEEGGQ